MQHSAEPRIYTPRLYLGRDWQNQS